MKRLSFITRVCHLVDSVTTFSCPCIFISYILIVAFSNSQFVAIKNLTSDHSVYSHPPAALKL